MLKLNKKGFTIVELVIVIAVVAILAAVLIPTFINLMQTANESADIQLVTNLNKLMAMQEALDGKNATMQDALDDAFANGYDISKISPTSKGNDIVWDQTADRFALVNAAEKKLIFRDEATPIKALDGGEIYTLWKIYDEKTGFPTKQTYSIYWAGASAPKDFDGTVSVGVDTGKCSFNISYSSNTAQDVIFRTNGGTLTVNNTTDGSHQTHYGTLTKADITTASNCFITHGQIAALELKAGKAIADKGGYLIVSSAASRTTVEYANGGIVTKSDDASVEEATVNVSSEADLEAFVIEIKTADDLAAFRDSVNGGMTYAGLTVKLTADINLSTQGNWNPIGSRYVLKGNEVVDTTKEEGQKFRKAFMGTFDGQGHTISGLFINTSNASYKGTRAAAGQNTSSYAALFGYVDKATVKNFTVEGVVSGCDVAGVIGILGEGCKVEGIVSNVDVGGKTGVNEAELLRGKAGGIINMTKGDGSTIKNCINNGYVCSDQANNGKDRGDYAGGIIALIQHATTIENCKNTGAVTTKNYYVGGIVGAASDNAPGKSQFIVIIKECENTGDITLTGSADPKDKGVGAIIGLCGAASAVHIDRCTNAETAKIDGKERYDIDSLVGVNAPSNGKDVTGVNKKPKN